VLMQTKEEVPNMSALPKPKEWTRTSCTLPDETWDKIERMLSAENAERPAPERLSRDRLMAHCIDWAYAEWEAERAKKRK
jgi:hypothetical protein